MKDLIVKQLLDNIKETNKDKSSHWSNYLHEKSDYENKFEHLGFGAYTSKSYKDILHLFLQKIIFGSQIFKTETYKKFKIEFDKQNRFIDSDTIRHVFTFEKLRRIVNPKNIAIIGDGKLNGVLGAYLTFPEAQIFNINLSETLINDYIILKDSSSKIKSSIELVNHSNFKFGNKKLYFVPSNFKKTLLTKDIDLFINIASFQEMNMQEIKKYFSIISNNKSKLYCCNREFKELTGGEQLYFNKYPWGNSKKIFWEDCPWYQKFYSLRPPFIRKYNGNIMHCLVDFF